MDEVTAGSAEVARLPKQLVQGAGGETQTLLGKTALRREIPTITRRRGFAHCVPVFAHLCLGYALASHLERANEIARPDWRNPMGRAQSMITVFAALGLLTFASSLAAQPSAPTGTKLQRSDRNFIVKAAKDGEEEVELGRLAQAKAPVMRSSSSVSAWSRTTAAPTRS